MKDIKLFMSLIICLFIQSYSYCQGYEELKIGNPLTKNIIDAQNGESVIVDGDFDYQTEKLVSGEVQFTIPDSMTLLVETNSNGNIWSVQFLYEIKTTVGVDALIEELRKKHGSFEVIKSDFSRGFFKTLPNNVSFSFLTTASAYNGEITKWHINFSYVKYR